MPTAMGTFETPLAMRAMQQIAIQFSRQHAPDDRPPMRVEIALAGGGIAKLRAIDNGLEVTLVSDDPQVIASTKRLLEGYFRHVAPGAGSPAVVWVDDDA